MAKLGKDKRGDTIPVLPLDQSTVQVIDGTSAAAATTVINAAEDEHVRIAAYSDIHIAFGANPTATAAHLYMPSGMVEWFNVKKGHKISVIGGKANISVGGE